MAPLWLFPGYGRRFGCATPWPFAVRSLGQPQTSSGTGTVTLPAHIYRPMYRDTYCYPFSLSPSSVPMGSYPSASGNLLGSISIWPTTLRQSGLPRRHNPAIASRVITFNGSVIDAYFKSPDALISRCPWCWFRFSIYRPRSSVTHSQREEFAATLPTKRLFVPRNWQLLDAESH